MKIKDLPKVDQPREKMEKYGPDKLSDKEILAIILRTGIKGCNVIELSKKVLNIVLKIGVENIKFENLLTIKGLGKTKSLQILASLELGKRLLKEKKTELVLSPKDVWDKMEDLRDSKKEHFVVFYLDTRNQIIKREIISIGTLNASLIHPREVFEQLTDSLYIIVGHQAICSRIQRIMSAVFALTGAEEFQPGEFVRFLEKRGARKTIDYASGVVISKPDRNRVLQVLQKEIDYLRAL